METEKTIVNPKVLEWNGMEVLLWIYGLQKIYTEANQCLYMCVCTPRILNFGFQTSFPTKRNQNGEIGQWKVQDKPVISSCVQSKRVLIIIKNNRNMLQGHRSQFEETPTDKSEDNMSIRIKNRLKYIE